MPRWANTLNMCVAVPEIEFEASSSIHSLNPDLRNKDKVGAWCKDFGDIDYGIIGK